MHCKLSTSSKSNFKSFKDVFKIFTFKNVIVNELAVSAAFPKI